MLKNIPLLFIPAVIYNVMALGGGVLSRSSEVVIEGLGRTVFSIPMASGTIWSVTSGNVIVFTALFLWFAEFIKAARYGPKTAINHILSLALFIVCLVEFLLIAAFASSVFFIILTMALLDVIAGYMMTTMPAHSENDFEEDFSD